MPIVASDGHKYEENCCAIPMVYDGECLNCGYNWAEHDDWESYQPYDD